MAIGINQITAVIRTSGDALVTEAESNKAFRDDLIENNASTVDTFNGDCRSRYHRYCVKARQRLGLRDSPKVLAINIDAVVAYV